MNSKDFKFSVVVEGETINLISESKDRRVELYNKFMDLTLDLIEQVQRYDIRGLSPDVIKELRENAQVLDLRRY
jgi:hypothetical protein